MSNSAFLPSNSGFLPRITDVYRYRVVKVTIYLGFAFIVTIFDIFKLFIKLIIKLQGFHICKTWSYRCEIPFLVKEVWHKIEDHSLVNVDMVS